MDAGSRAEQGWTRFYAGLLLTRRRGAYDVSVLDRLRRASEMVKASPDAALDLDRLAETACFSKYHFLRLFRQAYGETPMRYLTRVRLSRARELLETTDLSVTEVCLSVGYESLTSFSGAFRKQVGASPLRYRRRWLSVGAVTRPIVRVPACFVHMYA